MKMRYLYLIYVLYFHFAVFSQTTSHIDSLKLSFKQSKNYNDYSTTLNELIYQLHFSNSDSTIYYCNIGINQAKINKDTFNLGFYHNVIGVNLKNNAQYDSAITHLKLSKKYRQLIDFKEGIAGTNNNLATVYRQKGDYLKAISLYLESLIIFEDLNDYTNLGEVHSNIGELYIELNEYDLAEKHFNQSQYYYKLNGNTKSFAWVYNDLGLLKQKIGQIDSAFYFYQKSADIWKKHNRWLEYSMVLVDLSELHLENQQLNEAKNLLDEAENHFKQLSYTYGLSDVYLNQGQYFLQKKNYTQAIEKLKLALKISDFVNANGLTLNVYKLMADTYKQSHQNDSAVFYLEQYLELKDSLIGIEQTKTRLKYQTEYDVLNKEKQIQELTHLSTVQALEAKQKQLKNENQKIGLYALSAGVVLVLLFVFFLYRKNQQKTFLNQRLKMALSERDLLMREIHHRVKNNLQIVSSLLNLQSHSADKKTAKEVLKDSQDRIKSLTILHENLYKSKLLTDIDFKDYVKQLVENLNQSFNLEEKRINIVQEIDSYNLHIDYLVPCGLIINELITNSLKYAFPNQQKGTIFISGNLNQQTYELMITDDGVGFPTDFNPNTLKSIGLKLVNGLVRQLKGSISWDKSHKGTKAIIKFDIK